MTGDWTDDWGTDGTDGMYGTDGMPGGLGGLGDLPVLAGGEAPAGHLVLDIDGVSYGLPASHDLGPDAAEEAVTLTDDRGMAVCADTDGDGHVDRLSVVGFDGSWSSWERRPVPGEVAVPAAGPVTGVTGQDAAPDSDGPPVTPTGATDNWTVVGWECVERGGWG